MNKKVAAVGVSLYQRQLDTLVEIEEKLGGSIGRSAVLRRLIDDYIELEPIRNVIEARRRGLISHDEAMERLALLIARDSDGSTD